MGILCVNCENSLKGFSGSRIVSPLAMVRKSNMPALSIEFLSLVRCLVLRKFVGSVLKQVSPPQKCSLLRVGRGSSAQICCVKITFDLLLTTSFVSTKTNSMKCFVNWIPLNTHVRLNKTQPCLKVAPSQIS